MEIRDIRWSIEETKNQPAWSGAEDWRSGYKKLWLGTHSAESITVTTLEQFEKISSELDKSESLREVLFVPADEIHNGMPLWQAIFEFLEISPRAIGVQYSNSHNNEIPLLGLTLDRSAKKEILEDTTIVIPHWESLGFIELCLNSIYSVFSEGSRPKVLVIDDKSDLDTYSQLISICEKFGASLSRIERKNHNKTADVGKVLDFGISQVETKYVCMLDADTVILAKSFLLKPIEILTKLNCISVGLDTGLALSYHGQRKWMNYILRDGGLNAPGESTITNNLYRVMRTADAKAISKAIGFTRAADERKIRDQIGRAIRKIDSKFFFSTKANGFSKELIKKPLFNSKFPNMPPTSDNGVNANYWMDQNMMGWKFNIPIVSFGFQTPKDGICFQNISEMLIHIALSTRALSGSRREVDDAGLDFYEAVTSIVERKYPYQELRDQVIMLSRKHANRNA